ncbi:MAG: RNA methyltransferase [Eubacteriales bacterium]
MNVITSANNPRIKEVVQLIRKGKVREEKKLFVIEGIKLFLEAPKERIQAVFFSETFYTTYKKKEVLDQYSFDVVTDEVFVKMTDTIHPQGVLCVMKQFTYTLEELWEGENPFLLVVENMQDPGNLGTLLRTGEAAGVDGIILSKGSVDVYNPKVVRSSMGSIYRTRYCYAESIVSVINKMRDMNIAIYAAHLDGKTYFTDTDFTKATAFLVGNESKGLEQKTAELATKQVKIPMCGEVESLNVAMAAGLLMYEAKRQRTI